MNQRNELLQWEIVLLDFPFVDLIGKKLRPALIASNNNLNKISNAVIALQITSNIRSGFMEYNIKITDNDVMRYPGTKPLRPSLIKVLEKPFWYTQERKGYRSQREPWANL
ncbi:type II toxin-antitoxin system PemK/MazF family toxin [Pyrococcus kukulkanii]|uniref:type II toxin-antitoxin system PemK/MazF family toxin n=1 Tax=Pyrococcus kukulkanii TaxID=1609559 RepID=UPI0008306440|nr:type II toxin-antitoxin system PemK/MazF family toxin [Pyrococcus kukulkanii]